MSRKRWILLALMAGLLTPSAHAEESAAPNPMSKLAHSIAQVASSPADLVICPVALGELGHPIIGVAKGVGQSVVRLVTGAVDVVTCWAPGVSWADQLAGPPLTCTLEMP